MTDKKEAQPEALPDLDFDTAGHSGIRIRGYSVERVQSLHAEIQQLKAQLSARQAAPDALEMPEPDFYVRPSIAAFELPWGVCMHEDSGSQGAYLADTVRAMLSAAPPAPEREPQKGATNG